MYIAVREGGGDMNANARHESANEDMTANNSFFYSPLLRNSAILTNINYIEGADRGANPILSDCYELDQRPPP